MQGSADYTYEWKGATWRFASAENRDLFVTLSDRGEIVRARLPVAGRPMASHG